MKSVRLLLDSVIDYAGLFPPAGLGMSEAVQNYARYHGGASSWALGRMVVPVIRLGEFEACAEDLRLPRPSEHEWRLSVLGGADPKSDLQQIAAFNRRHEKSAAAAPMIIDAIEWKARSTAEIERSSLLLAGHLEPYFEIPPDDNAPGLLAAIARTHSRAKVRTGGLTQDMFPSPARLAGFIQLCVEMQIRFKATAGLHHALRAMHPLTYAPASPSAIMHGFLNLMLAATFALAGAGTMTTEEILQEESIEAFEFDDGGVRWRGRFLSERQLAGMRERLFVTFGACSFEEPISEMKALNLE